jgi:hypothetical protein
MPDNNITIQEAPIEIKINTEEIKETITTNNEPIKEHNNEQVETNKNEPVEENNKKVTKTPKEKKEKVPKEKKEKVPKEKKETPTISTAEITNNGAVDDEIELDVSTIIFEDKQYLMDNENNIYDYNTNEKIGFYKDYAITFV